MMIGSGAYPDLPMQLADSGSLFNRVVSGNPLWYRDFVFVHAEKKYMLGPNHTGTHPLFL